MNDLNVGFVGKKQKFIYSQNGEFHRKFKGPSCNVKGDIEINPAVKNAALRDFPVSKLAKEEEEKLCISTENS